MAGDLTTQSDRLIREGRSLVHDNQNGGRHRANSIGEGSRRLKRKSYTDKLRFFGISVLAIVSAATLFGILIDPIGFVGVMLVIMATIAMGVIAGTLVGNTRTPERADLEKTRNAKELVARTELWLESQRPALPPPAVRLVEDIGVQLDGLGAQLEHVDPAHPAAGETRKLVGEVLPEMIDSYRKIPQHLRREERAGSTPDKQLVESLGKISKEIDHVTRQLAEGSLDDLAIRTRYLDYKYGDAEGLPPPDKS